MQAVRESIDVAAAGTFIAGGTMVAVVGGIFIALWLVSALFGAGLYTLGSLASGSVLLAVGSLFWLIGHERRKALLGDVSDLFDRSRA